jgi:hypothetical protein
MTVEPIREADTVSEIPEYIRLPKTGKLCNRTGLSRSYLNALILPTDENKHRPPVKSVCLRRKGAKTGVRLIVYASLLEFLHKHEATGEVAA